MSLFARWFGKKSGVATSDSKAKQPKFVKKEKTPGGTYEVYKGTTPEAAREFLLTKRVDEEKYYIVVETPEGNWGADVKGLYLEHFLPFQKNIKSAECDGTTCGMPDIFGLQMAAKGINDNFIAQVQCGKCEREWYDGLRYQELTVVKCPGCNTLNKIDSSNFKVVLM